MYFIEEVQLKGKQLWRHWDSQGGVVNARVQFSINRDHRGPTGPPSGLIEVGLQEPRRALEIKISPEELKDLYEKIGEMLESYQEE